MPIGLAVPVLRGLFNLPSAIQQEGVGGVSTAFFNPERVERQRRVQGALEENQPEEAEIDRILAAAQDADDLEPAFGLFQQLQHHAVQTGLVNSEQEYQQVLGPVMGRLAGAARKFIVGDTAQQARGVLGLGARIGSPQVAAEGEQLSRLAGREAQTKAAYALAGLRDAQQGQLPERTQLIDAQTQAAQAAAAASNARAQQIQNAPPPNAPRLGDLDRLDKEIRSGMSRAGQTDLRTGAVMAGPPAELFDERNQRAGQLQRPYIYEQGGQLGTVHPGADQVMQGLGLDPSRVQSTLREYPRQPTGMAGMPQMPVAPAAPAAAAPPATAAPQQPIPSPTPVISGRALAQQLMEQYGISAEEAKARVRAMIAQQQQGGAGANPR